MKNHSQDREEERADMLSGVLPLVALLFALAAIPVFLMTNWSAALSLLVLALIIYSLGAILDLLLVFSRRLKRLESKFDKPADKQ